MDLGELERKRAKRREYSRNWRKANPERQREIACKSREKNRETACARTAAWRLAHPEQAKAVPRKWRQENPEKARLGKAAWYYANLEKAKETMRIWQTAHPEAKRVYNRTRRALKIGSGGSHTDTEWRDTLDYFNQACAYCLKYILTPQGARRAVDWWWFRLHREHRPGLPAL